jgi:hypothetical protein
VDIKDLMNRVLDVWKLISLPSSKRIPLVNGALEYRLYQFHLVQGGARRGLVSPAQT